jgi:hypothetical protein
MILGHPGRRTICWNMPSDVSRELAECQQPLPWLSNTLRVAMCRPYRCCLNHCRAGIGQLISVCHKLLEYYKVAKFRGHGLHKPREFENTSFPWYLSQGNGCTIPALLGAREHQSSRIGYRQGSTLKTSDNKRKSYDVIKG